MDNIVLQDTTLCAIVRDEMMNPAGGIRDFIECTVPFVEQAVLVDTGSTDGTLEELERLTKSYPNMNIFQHIFKGFATARNYSLSQAKTKHVLILDADERLMPPDYAYLSQTMIDLDEPDDSDDIKQGINLGLLDIYSDGSVSRFGSIHNPRIFNLRNDSLYEREVWEVMSILGSECLDLREQVKVKHFKASKEGNELKRKYYAALKIQIDIENDNDQGYTLATPQSFVGFQEWKKYNPMRMNFS